MPPMMVRLLTSLYLFCLVFGQVYMEDFESQYEDIVANETLSARSNGVRYGAHVEKVELANACSQYKSQYADKFYGGFVTNSRSWRDKTGATHERFTTLANINIGGQIISSTCGAVPSKNNQLVSSWDWMQFASTFQDIRKKEPAKLRLTLMNHFPQVYIPLYLANSATGKAYMLHLYPEKLFLGNPDNSSFDDGLLWARYGGSLNTVYHVEIDTAGLIRNIQNFTVPNYQQFITSLGQLWYMKQSHLQSTLSYPRVNHFYLQGGSVTGAATEYICRTGTPSMDISWTLMNNYLRQQFTWL